MSSADRATWLMAYFASAWRGLEMTACAVAPGLQVWELLPGTHGRRHRPGHLHGPGTKAFSDVLGVGVFLAGPAFMQHFLGCLSEYVSASVGMPQYLGIRV